MRNQYYLDEDKLHPELQKQLPTAVETTKLVALKYYPMLSDEFESINDFELHLQGKLFEPLSLINFMLNGTMPQTLNIDEVIPATLFNYFKSYIESDLVDFRLEPKLDSDEILIFGFKVKIWMCNHRTLQIRFCGEEKEIQKLSSQIGATYKPITDEERMYGISFFERGIS